MAETTGISWADMTWSPWYGCTQVSMGPQGACEGCYARHMSETRFKRVVFGGPGRGEGTRDVRADSAWRAPLKWEREQAALWEAWDLHCEQQQTQWPVSPMSEPQPRFVFPSMCDPFDNHPDLREPRRRFVDLMWRTPDLTWLLLTKRPGNIVKLFMEALPENAHEYRGLSLDQHWPRNAAIGCTVVSQEEADRDIPKLLAAKAALNPAFAFLSLEPLLGPVDLTALKPSWPGRVLNALTGDLTEAEGTTSNLGAPGRLDWIIAGGETDQGAHKARPANPRWFRALRDQCAAAGVLFEFKQWGEWLPHGQLLEDGSVNLLGTADDWHHFGDGETAIRIGKNRDPCTLDGVLHRTRPEIA